MQRGLLSILAGVLGTARPPPAPPPPPRSPARAGLLLHSPCKQLRAHRGGSSQGAARSLCKHRCQVILCVPLPSPCAFGMLSSPLCAQGVQASSVLESPGSCWYPLAGSILLDGRTMAGRETRSSHLLCWSNAARRAPELLVQDFWPPDIQERLCPRKAARVSQTAQCPPRTASRRMLFFK